MSTKPKMTQQTKQHGQHGANPTTGNNNAKEDKFSAQEWLQKLMNNKTG